ncbi:uncharacterized protein OCT59_000189 [Rhizophagus irregularis]|uniref:F-box domain-containing protein n=2 Tax=Rhizophagus irregularis TaxID=588596 RepID=A0A015L473_RHIIW|nr:hypothetical protein GLOIN_2v1774323 [Rhizophagus irregularis DAOM 181602=DAOM 197198]EXX67261.1 hypothetical protein RirG_116020 [Rhizophagus irregularis DAOM 197198w]POG71936.1 hypothetical protein GLOIN_2v1774323 [Rhizophagus irregularis DAOM 181602=DAOM 197198]UZN98904.1 hypothetical protein OCT59_000189 [Rhizophagus irregularis]GBC49734.1 hypothetical protein GLOIN_2v1774323 [Rhizophagus irregularis DAOM 181602=DAOM 197198]|eukprot:XP_025178802.1 hypothetical protein GLOIN_2v1774323 [Rhizophagus irregularis DAOM 181602=DAOM 197198]
MACSKIFSGDLPELTYKIVQYFRKDFSTLYSCILVNRFWCRLAIPLLWEDPFSAPTKNYHCIEIYSHYFNEDSKAKFNGYGIYDLVPTYTLFNYPSFIKYLNMQNIRHSIGKWIETLMKYDYCNKLGNLVYKSLFEIFIGNGGNLHSFEVVMAMDSDFNYTIMELILQNPNFIYNIRNIKFFYNYNSSPSNIMNIIPFLKFLYSNCYSISSIIFHFHIFNVNSNDFSLIEKCFSQIIISQHNLKMISFGSNDILHNPFLSLKNSLCSNTLNTIIFDSIDFRNIITILQEVFDQLNVLESIHILYCDSLNSNFVQQIIKVIKPFKLKSLFMNEILNVESLLLLLQKFGDYLENFGFGFIEETKYDEPKRQLLEFILKYCTNLIYFDPGTPDDINIYSLIQSGQNINYLTIELDDFIYHTIYKEYSSNVLKNLGQVLPSNLEYLCLSISFNIHDLKIFLNNSQNIFIKKLLIKNIDGERDILFYIKEYIMKKERVKYFAFLDAENEENEGYNKELVFLKDEVNEFKLYNIIVQKYVDLYITASSFLEDYYILNK